MLLSTVGTAIIPLIAGAAGRPVDDPAVSARAAIERVIQRFIAAYDAGDVAAVVDCYDPALVKLRAGAPPGSRADVERRLREAFAAFSGSVGAVVDEIVVSGDIAFTRGSFTVTLTSRKTDARQQIARRYVEIWRRVDGRWLVFRTMDNEGAY